jgi:hypothetical protein
VLSVVELSSRDKDGDGESEGQSAILRTIARFDSKLKASEPEAPQGRLFVNVASNRLPLLFGKSDDLAPARGSLPSRAEN